MKKIMKEKNQVVPDEVLSKEFLSQFKTEADVSKFLKQLHAQVLEKMLEGEMDAHLGYEKNPKLTFGLIHKLCSHVLSEWYNALFSVSRQDRHAQVNQLCEKAGERDIAYYNW